MTRKYRGAPLLSPLDRAKAAHDERQREQRRMVEEFVAVVKATGGQPRDLGPNVIDLIPLRVRRGDSRP